MRLGEVSASRARGDGGLKVALPRGALFDGTLDLLDRIGVDTTSLRSDSRSLVFEADGLMLVTMRPSDVPTYVEAGAADVGITGKDVLLEQRDRAVYELLDLRYGACRLVLAARRGDDALDEAERRLGAMRIATKYPRAAERWFQEAGRRAEVIEVKGSVELAPAGGPRRRDRRPGGHRADAGRERPRGARGDHDLHGAARCQPRRPQASRRRGGSAGRPDAGGDRMKIERIDWDGTDAPAFAARLRKLASPQEEVAETVAEIVAIRSRPRRRGPPRDRGAPGRGGAGVVAGGPGRDRGGPRAAGLRRSRGAAARGEEHRRGRACGARDPRPPGDGRPAGGPAGGGSRRRGGGGRRLRAGGQGGVPVLGLDVLHPGARRGGEPRRGREPGRARAVAPARRCWRRAQQRASTRCTRSAARRRSPRSPTARRASTASI